MGYALTAGLTVREALAAPPGLIMTLYLQRRDYDDALHGADGRHGQENIHRN